eukprot:4515141-Amphidinium_carterae.1
MGRLWVGNECLTIPTATTDHMIAHGTGVRGTVFTDGSAAHPQIPHLRRAAWGVWCPATGYESFGLLPHRVCGGQTVYEAELYGVLQALRARLPGAPLTIYTDNKAVFTGIDAGPGRLRQHRHGDLWAEVADLWDETIDT